MRNERANAMFRMSRCATWKWLPIAALGIAANACDKGPAESKPAAAPLAAPSSETASALDAVLRAYESVRAAFADDAIAKGVEAAVAIETAATAATGTADAPLASVLRDVASAAGALKAISTTDADAVRKAFGEVSRGVVALVSAVPSLQRGRYVFECPMAQGYKRWVQLSDSIANPYMGKAMLTCGAPRTW